MSYDTYAVTEEKRKVISLVVELGEDGNAVAVMAKVVTGFVNGHRSSRDSLEAPIRSRGVVLEWHSAGVSAHETVEGYDPSALSKAKISNVRAGTRCKTFGTQMAKEKGLQGLQAALSRSVPALAKKVLEAMK